MHINKNLLTERVDKTMVPQQINNHFTKCFENSGQFKHT